MVKDGKGKEVGSSSTTYQKKPKKVKEKRKRKSTFYSFPVQSDNEVPESVPPPPSEPEPDHSEDGLPNSLESETDVDLTDNVDSVDIYDLNFKIRTRKTESHWYMIYYDGSIEITDDEDSDGIENSGGSLQSAQELSFGCTIPNDIHRGHDNEMVCAINLLCEYAKLM